MNLLYPIFFSIEKNSYFKVILFSQDDLMEELEQLEQEELDKQMLEIGEPSTDQLPSVPTEEPVPARKYKLSQLTGNLTSPLTTSSQSKLSKVS